MNKIDFNAIFDNTESVKRLAELTILPEPKYGNEKVKFCIGQTVRCLATATLIEGTEFEISSSSAVNGYIRYFGAGMWHRQKDLEKVA